jgi:hypothetical protein
MACVCSHVIVNSVTFNFSCDWANKINELDDAASHSSAIEVRSARPQTTRLTYLMQLVLFLFSLCPASLILFEKKPFLYHAGQVNAHSTRALPAILILL